MNFFLTFHFSIFQKTLSLDTASCDIITATQDCPSVIPGGRDLFCDNIFCLALSLQILFSGHSRSGQPTDWHLVTARNTDFFFVNNIFTAIKIISLVIIWTDISYFPSPLLLFLLVLRFEVLLVLRFVTY